MNSIKRYKKYKTGKKCSVSNCDGLAEYEVYLYDFYPHNNHEFFEQDFTCPFLCSTHMEENESQARGVRKPRSVVYYPYTNRQLAQGYTKYSPLSEVFPQIYKRSDDYFDSSIIAEIVRVNDALIAYLAQHPEKMRELHPRKFEELIARLFEDMDFSVQLTPRTRDGGKDIYAIQKAAFGTTLYLIECKRYSSERKVGVEPVRGLFGVAQADKATMGILATTSSFTKDAIDFAKPLSYQLSLRDFNDLKKWLLDYGK